MLNKLLDGFDGKLITSKWAKIANCSQDTALRDIQDLLEKMYWRKEQPVEEVQAIYLQGESTWGDYHPAMLMTNHRQNRHEY